MQRVVEMIIGLSIALIIFKLGDPDHNLSFVGFILFATSLILIKSTINIAFSDFGNVFAIIITMIGYLLRFPRTSTLTLIQAGVVILLASAALYVTVIQHFKRPYLMTLVIVLGFSWCYWMTFLVPTTQMLRESTILTRNQLHNEDAIATFLDEKLPVNTSTVDDVWHFVGEQQLECDDDPVTTIEKIDYRIWCTVRITDSSFYDWRSGLWGVIDILAVNLHLNIVFNFENEVLKLITIGRGTYAV